MSQDQKLNITVVGCGKMGASLIHGWIKKSLAKQIDIIDPQGLPDSLSSAESVFHVKQITEADLMRTDIVILCVKPQIMDVVCAGLKDYLPAGAPILSIAAGKDLTYFESQFTDQTPIIRTMPNLPATVNKGMTALIANTSVTENQKVIATTLMSACGETLWIEDESLMDAVTAISGSGPAYVFHMVEAIASAGEKLGLSAEQSMAMARQTIIGSADLLDHSNGISAADLREAVTSKGGTTQAALDVLMDGQFQDSIDKTTLAAYMRSKELAD